jgi:anti-sigma factor RsiW
MNCEKCQELLSDYLDGSLGFIERRSLSVHLESCQVCADVREELRSIVTVARQSRDQAIAPPDERALWFRIRASIEQDAVRPRGSARSAWSRLFTSRWEFSFPQLASGVAALAAAVALVTVMGVQYFSTAERAVAGRGTTGARDAFLRENYPHGYLQPHEASLQFWQQRVESRKASWNPRMRQSFDRSLLVLDEAVTESLGELKRNPHDEVAEQMLNSALRDKIELLREFGEQ